MLAVLLSLLASSSALLAGIFMLQQLKSIASLPAQVENVQQQVANIDTTIDLGGIEGKYDNLATQFNEMATDLHALQENQEQLLADASNGVTAPVIQAPPTEKPAEKPAATPSTDTATSTSKATTTSRLNLRNATGTDASVIKTLAKGAGVELLGEEKKEGNYTWAKVKDGSGSIGWVAKNYIK